jgi:hypothetical protein
MELLGLYMVAFGIKVLERNCFNAYIYLGAFDAAGKRAGDQSKQDFYGLFAFRPAITCVCDMLLPKVCVQSYHTRARTHRAADKRLACSRHWSQK